MITDEQIGEIAEQVGLVGPASRVGDCHAASLRFARAVLALAAPAPAVPSDERAAFEAWKRTMLNGFDAWDAWQARAALTAAPTPPAQSERVGAWLSAMLEDPKACNEFKADVRAWFAAGMPSAVPEDVARVNKQMLEALEAIASDYAERFDLSSPSTNPGIKSTIAQARAAIDAARAAEKAR